MLDQSTVDDLEIYCMICCQPLGDDDDIHFITGPYGFDLDVVCGQCMDKVKQQAASGSDEGGPFAGLDGTSSDSLVDGDWGDAAR